MRGRPRIHATASDASRSYVQRKITAGCSRKTFMMTNEAVDGLQAIRTVTGERFDTEIIERLISEASGRSQTT